MHFCFLVIVSFVLGEDEMDRKWHVGVPNSTFFAKRKEQKRSREKKIRI